MLSGGFFLFMMYIFYWAVVVHPRRVRQLFVTLVKKGYQAVGDTEPDMLRVLSTLAPIYPHTPSEDYPIPAWKVVHACKQEQTQHTRYILDVARSQAEGVGSDKYRRRVSVMFLEQGVLNVPETIHLTPSTCYHDWGSRFGLIQVQDGIAQEFREHYHVFTTSGTIENLPDTLQNVLLKVLPLTEKFRILGLTLMFRRDGWGICTGQELSTLKDMELMIDVADMIAETLKQDMRGEVASRSEGETFEPTAFEAASLAEDKAFEPTEFQEEVPQKLLFDMKPVFLPWQTFSSALFSMLPLNLMMALIGGFFLGAAGNAVVQKMEIILPVWGPFAVSCGFCFFLIPLVVYIHTRSKRKRIEYRFYTTRLEYGNELSSKEKKRLDYKDVFGMKLRQGRSQKRNGVGTLVFLTLPTENPRRSEIEVADIQNPYEVYTQIKERVNSISHRAVTSTNNTQHRSKISPGSPLEKVETQEPLFVLKPVFLPWVTLLSALPVQLALTLAGGGVAGLIVGFLKMFQVYVSDWLPVAVVAGVLFFAIPSMVYWHKKKKYQHTGYGFYATEFTGYRGTSPVEITTIHYDNISGVSFKKGFFQKKHGLGTLFLLTRASSDAGHNIARSRIKLTDIPNPDEVYAQIKELVKKTS
jgi:membrane protein YdbS with pleckstrin-like domain